MPLDPVGFDMFFWGFTLSTVGKLILGATVMLVHSKIVHEHKIDDVVIKEMKKERSIAFAAIVMIGVGYALEVTALGYFG